MKYIRIVSTLLILQMAFTPFIYAQEEDEADVTKYTIKEYLEANLPPQEGRMIVLDELTGLLTITDTPKNQEVALMLIRQWDIGPKQIQIEAKFIEITFTDIDELGVDWKLIREGSTKDPQITSGPASSPGGGSYPTYTGTGLMGSSSAVLFGQAAETAGLGFLIGKAALKGIELAAYLKALEQSGKANLLNAPRVTTLSGQMANIQVVRSFPYAVSAETTQVEVGYNYTGDDWVTVYEPIEVYEVEEEIVGITLEVTPTVIEGSDIVTLDIHPEVTKLDQQVDITSSEFFPDDLGWPIIDARSAQTSVMVRSGETVVLGGLIQDKDSYTVERKVPFLGDIPLLGELFKYKYEKREKKNLIILLTVKLIDTMGEEVKRE